MLRRRARKQAADAAPAKVYDASPEARLDLAARLWQWQPHPGQRAFLTLRLDDGSEPKTLVAACGRRWGKTEALGCDVSTRILTEPDLGQMGVAPTRDQAEGLYDSVEEKLRELLDGQEDAKAAKRLLDEFPHLADLEFKRSPYPLIRNRKTGQMVFWVRAAGRNGRNLRGRGTTRKLKRFRVICDERAFIDDGAVESAIKPMLATSPGGGQLVEISSPWGKRGGFYDDYVKGERLFGRYRAVRLPSDQNPLVDAEWLAEQRIDMTDAAYRTEFLAEFLDTAGAVFLEGDIVEAVCDDDYGALPLWGCRYVAGIDFARRGDWTVCAILEVSPIGCRLVELFRIQGLGFAAQVEKLIERLAHWGVCRVTPDRTGIGDAIVENLIMAAMAKRLPCEFDEFVFTGSSKPVLIDALVLALARRSLRYPPHPVLLSELRNFEATPSTQAGGREKMEARKGHDDCVCALALAVRAASVFMGRSGSPVVSTGGKRTTSGAKGGDSSWDFSGGYPLWAAPSGPVLSVMPAIKRQARRLLATVYRFAPARSAGASLANLTRSTRRSTRPAG